MYYTVWGGATVTAPSPLFAKQRVGQASGTGDPPGVPREKLVSARRVNHTRESLAICGSRAIALPLLFISVQLQTHATTVDERSAQ